MASLAEHIHLHIHLQRIGEHWNLAERCLFYMQAVVWTPVDAEQHMHIAVVLLHHGCCTVLHSVRCSLDGLLCVVVAC